MTRYNGVYVRVLFLLAIAFAFNATAWGTVCTAGATSLATYGAAGCSVGNVLFSNFSVGTTTNTIVGPINTITPGPNTVILPDGTTITAAAVGGGLTFTTGAVPPCTTGSFCVSGKNQSLTSTVTYEMSTLDSSTTITTANLLATLHSHANNTSAAVFLEICPGDMAFGQACGGYQVGQLGSINGQNITLSNAATTLSFTGVNRVWIRETVYLTTNNGTGSDAEVNDFGIGPAGVPEPSTYGMVGLALTGLGFLKLRRKRS